jgi:hypothetical protein
MEKKITSTQTTIQNAPAKGLRMGTDAKIAVTETVLTRNVDSEGRVEVGGMFFTSLRLENNRNIDVEIWIDRVDLSRIWVKIDREWFECHSLTNSANSSRNYK